MAVLPIMWPPLQFLAQFHHQLALDLGAPGRILFLFMCENEDGECETFGQTAGANAAIIVDAHEQTDSPQKFPAATSNPVFLVRAYREADDGVPPEQANEFYAHANYLNVVDSFESISECTRLGGVPSWVQSPDEGPGNDWRYVLQLAEDIELDVHLSEAQERKRHTSPWKRRDWGANFGTGLAYVFLSKDPSQKIGRFFWQCG